MEVSVLIARAIALVYLAAAVGGLVSRDYYRRVLGDAFSNAALTYFMGFVAIVFGFLMVSYHNVWEWDWRVLVTIVGWLALVKGVLLMAFPGFVRGYSSLVLGGKGLTVFPYVLAIVGLLFGYFGFVH